MLESGTFLSKVNLYMYCERYMVAMENPAYAELVKHPAPIAILNIPICLLSLIPRTVASPGIVEASLIKASEYFSLFMFWLEYIVLVPAFFAYSLLLVPIAYLVNFGTIIQSTHIAKD